MKKLLTALSLALSASLCWATLSTDYEPAQYDTNGSVTQFTAQWGFFSTTDLIVTYTTNGVDTVLVEGSGAGKYTVYAANQDYSNGATVTTGTTYPSPGTITIERSVPEGQQLSINGDFVPAKPLETQLDKLAAQIQQVSDQQVRSIKFPATDPALTTYDVGSAVGRAGKALGFAEDGSVTELVIASEGGAFTAVDENAGLTASGGTISGKVDGDTLEFSSGNFAIKAQGVGATQLEDTSIAVGKLASTTGSDTAVVTGTAGTADYVAKWNADGDVVEGPEVASLATEAYVDASSTDGFVPTAYAGEESVTFPNGLIIKSGISTNGTTVGVTFTSAFPAGIISVTTSSATAVNYGYVSSVTTNGFTLNNVNELGNPASAINYWQAIGY